MVSNRNSQRNFWGHIIPSHYAKCYYIKLFFPSPPKKQIYVCRMPYLVWFWVYWFMKHGLSDLKIKIKSWKILFFEDNFGNLGDKWVQLFFFWSEFDGKAISGVRFLNYHTKPSPFLGSYFYCRKSNSRRFQKPRTPKICPGAGLTYTFNI